MKPIFSLAPEGNNYDTVIDIYANGKVTDFKGIVMNKAIPLISELKRAITRMEELGLPEEELRLFRDTLDWYTAES